MMALLGDYPFTVAVLEDRERWALVDEECLGFLRRLPDNSVDSVVTDPPAAISLMSRAWDTFKNREAFVGFLTERAAECLRVLKPGGHMLTWALPRTSHWTAWAIEDAGFEIRDCVYHIFGNGFAKGGLLDKTIQRKDPTRLKEWAGWGTTLKPAAECWSLARKPFSGTATDNVLAYGTGALNVDACRIETDEKLTRKLGKTTTSPSGWTSANRSPIAGKDGGRWPANVTFSHNVDCGQSCTAGCPVAELDRQSGRSKSREGKPRQAKKAGDGWGMTKTGAEYNDEGGASRFFYCAKPSRKEKEAGLDAFPEQPKDAIYGAGLNSATKIRTEGQRKNGVDRGGAKNNHPTVKSIKLMRYLCRLITPSNGIVLDPFAGSGTTGCGALLEGLRFIGIENNSNYAVIATARIEYWERHASL